MYITGTFSPLPGYKDVTKDYQNGHANICTFLLLQLTQEVIQFNWVLKIWFYIQEINLSKD